MKICLIHPPIEDFYYTSIRRQPLGLLYVSAALSAAGHEPELINSHTDKKTVLKLPQKFKYLEKYINNPDPFLLFPFSAYSHFGMSFQEIEQRIRKSDSGLFMISCMFTTYHEEYEIIIEMIKRHKPSALIAVGGYHASLYAEHFLRNTDTDFVFTGEGEYASAALVQALETSSDLESVPGLSYIENGKTVCNSKISNRDIDAFIFPERDFLSDRNFRFYRKKMTSIIASRGCPHSCKFCTGKIIWGRTYRMRSAESVISEIDHCVRRHGISCFNFEDDNLFPTAQRAHELLNALGKYQKDKNISLEFTAMNGTSVENLDRECLKMMKEAGFHEINISLVTQSNLLQKTEKRPFSTEHFEKTVKNSLELGLKVRSYFILGLPGQTKLEISATIEFLKSVKIPFFPSVYYDVHSEPGNWKCQRSSAFFNETEELSRDDLLRFFNICRNSH